MVELGEIEFLIEGVRVVGGEHPTADCGEVGVGKDGFDEPCAKTVSAIVCVDKDIEQVGEDGVITDHACNADLFFVFVHTEDERMIDGVFVMVAGATFSPVGVGEQVADGVHVQAFGVGADGEAIAMGFDDLGHGASVSQPVCAWYHRRIIRRYMLKPIRWNTFLRDFIRIQIGFILFGLAISLMIRGNIGTSAWVVLEAALAYRFGITVGTMTVIMGFVVLGSAVAMREKLGWGTLANILSIGPWVDLWNLFMPSVTDNLPLQIAMLLVAILLMGLGSAIYIGVDAGAGPRDSLMLAIKRTTGVSIRTARAMIEVTVVTIGWLLGGPAGIGTLVYAILVGPSIQWGFKIFNVQPHKEDEVVQASIEGGVE